MDDPRWLSGEQLRAWRLLASVLALLPGELEGPLARHGLNYYEYSVMAGLSDQPDRSLRMSQLAEWSNGSLSRLSHVVSRLEKRGLVCRRPCPEDGRVTLAQLTDDGMALMEQAAPDHVASVRHLVFDVLDDDQVAELDRICSAITHRIGFDEPPPWATDRS
ncbi:MarR family winged helix-turn-helix transcriptional regulator [Salsipaludibacter albus]|uniref:MarR family winged helix-turn-helix transcriptional regulator n=1 Tax=Salsipaludibacter albus TaxID=2849650 RepID=UPI001EE44376|nr:MarR family transcriptional regulator [Salsipaludibacter albus]MBY5162432.1 MarR family transcriptional regulator [Salsipaludibacter albus]